MVFHSMHSFLHMGGYADYVWSAYALFFVSISVFSAIFMKRLRKRMTS
ncbi:MAG: heme exporter protein CcmD [Coxiella sp. (in: Bacteria)]|nr:MAG: heme exporter protein CcmD [Coxiella sp. (in: g-proteobacteria)]